MNDELWTIQDYLENLCELGDVNQPKIVVWTYADAINKRCSFDDIGTLKNKVPPPEVLPEPENIDLSSLSDRELAVLGIRMIKQATLETFQSQGGKQWVEQLARDNPKQYLSLLQRMIPQEVSATVEHTGFQVPTHIKELSTTELKLLVEHRRKQSLANPSTIIDAEFTEVKI